MYASQRTYTEQVLRPLLCPPHEILQAFLGTRHALLDCAGQRGMPLRENMHVRGPEEVGRSVFRGDIDRDELKEDVGILGKACGEGRGRRDAAPNTALTKSRKHEGRTTHSTVSRWTHSSHRRRSKVT
jgi:hypothetical protein